ncbi:MCE family protein [Hoyosella subflava]|uniref:Putative Mce family protein n=1 Tax=Hoyosella subflava (strain DSM 45089 / JCM 17490 / NBRC 109087 / DQS3-9A1) TaxID=443218 RepID=F6EN09_HOYSD|nr:MCE family protein [Hoyosella subflava]AEF39326.1 Putative Mce family protein [Hoyosella subflava DQS3-9A1]
MSASTSIKDLWRTLTSSGATTLRVRRPGLIGLVGIALVGALFVGASVLPQVTYLLRTTSYSVELAESGGLSPGDPIYVAGVPAGKVDQIVLDGPNVRADFRVERRITLGERTTAAVKLRTVLGKMYLEIKPNGVGELDDNTIPLARSSVPFSLDEIARAAHESTEGLNFDQLGQLTELTVEALPENPEVMRDAITTLNATAALINDSGDQIEQVLTLARDVASIVDAQQSNFDSLLVQGSVILQSLADRHVMLVRLTQGLETVAGQLDELFQDRPGLIPNLRNVMRTLADQAATLETILEQGAPAFQKVADVTGSGPWVDVNTPTTIIPDNLLCLLGAVEGCQ